MHGARLQGVMWLRVGITQRSADWLTKWSREVAAARVVKMASFEGLGRVMCVVSALEYDRPFLAPLYPFHDDYVRFILNYIAEEVVRNAPLSL